MRLLLAPYLTNNGFMLHSLLRIVIGIYGLIISVILAESIPRPNDQRQNLYSIYTGMAHVSWCIVLETVHISVANCLQRYFLTRVLQLAAGLCCGLSGLAAGGCIGIVGEYGVRCVGYRASNITLFPGKIESAGYATIPDQTHGGDNEDLSGSDDQNKLFVGMLIMLIFSEALAL